MKRFLLLCLPVFFAACQQSGTEQKTPEAVDSLSVAIANMRKDLQVRPTDAATRIYLANALIEQGNYAAADSQAAVLEKHPATLPNAYYIYGLSALNREDTAAAIDHLEKAISIRKDSSEYEAVMLTADLLFKTRSYNKAMELYALAAFIDSSAAEASYAIGEVYVKQGRETQAKQQFVTALQRDPAYSPAYIALGELLSKYGKWKEALPHFNMAAKADPTNADAFYLRGRALLALGNKPAGIDDLTKALSFRKDFPEARHLLDSVKNH
ncbi:tetratricopeptide repeat protein [Chitinophaga sp. GCM10012297]|uniref:Tetratricopeptide repeat protein n=1 Tax=Chitinophaga chungangae TaxID=2821488 RepID=A0ABS3YGR4_9BACT|nr:tetratricopeptide repeat protein [Chitinophaga chungangae]MBO9153862.1 tetratricopeptide repeat protein [Chitinophaga chungangae]